MGSKPIKHRWTCVKEGDSRSVIQIKPEGTIPLTNRIDPEKLQLLAGSEWFLTTFWSAWSLMAITHFFCSWHSSRSFSVIYIYTHYLPICRQRTSPCGYIYIYTYTHTYIYIHTYIHIYILTYWHIDMYTYIHIYIYVYMWHSGFEWRLTPRKLVDVRLNFGHPFFHGQNW